MSTKYVDNSVQSLVEKKKQQWAREREELAGLSDNAPWISRDSQHFYDRPFLRARYASQHQKDIYLRRESSSTVTPTRRPSLPPLYKNQNIAYASNEKLDKEMGGETSGYGSDNPNQTPEYFPPANWSHGNQPINIGQHHLGYESSSSGREDRPKWGDRGVHSGKFWESKEVENTDTPGWVKRGLETDSALVVSNTSPAESPEQDFGNRPQTGSSTSHNTRCYIRGQNVPLEPGELEERDKKRQIALAHQEAVRQQLEERERKRAEDKARKKREEYEEDQRIIREQETERKRREEEMRLREEKLEREMRRKEALKEAIAIAEKEAKEEKQRQKLMKQNICENVVNVEKVKVKTPVKVVPEVNENVMNHAIEDFDKNATFVIHNEDTNNSTNNNTSNNTDNNTSNNTNNNTNNNTGLSNSMIQISQENLAIVLQNPLESLQNIQLAFLIPNNTSGNPVTVPLATDRSANTARTENRLLTPSQYRNNKRFCDSSTQTDFPEFKEEKYVREKLGNLEISYETRFRKERRSRSEFRENVEDRPKWGVNRPPTRYLKQSEKDPLYQRRKMKKMRQIKIYDDAHSSDESQTGSPRSYRKKGYAKRHSRALWHKNEQLFAENVRVYQTEIIPLESDKDHIYFKAKHPHYCCCRCKQQTEKYSDQVNILKIEHNSPRECSHYKTHLSDKLPECNDHWSNNENILYSPNR